MTYNLTEKQKDLARWIVGEVRSEHFDESFTIQWFIGGADIYGGAKQYDRRELLQKLGRGELDALAQANLLLITINNRTQSGGGRHL